jgi:hypothetical protein
MSPTIEDVYKACESNELDDLSFPSFVDYFGIHNLDKPAIEGISREQIILGLYQGLMFHEHYGVTKDMLHEQLLNYNLDKFIHDKFKDRQTGYYKLFKDSLNSLTEVYSL